jgi:uncharacterized phage protein (predicted DNA packaging)
LILILKLEEAKSWLKIERDMNEDDTFITSLIIAAELYIKNGTGKVLVNSNELAKLAIKMLVSHWYSNREVCGKNDLLPYSLNAILIQLACSEV